MSDYMAQEMDRQIEGAQHTFAAMSDRIAELEAQAKASEWQPIETAPKDGTEIWTYDPTDHQSAGYWFSCKEWEGWMFSDELLADVKPDGMTPTHWMPLPAPPKSTCESA